MALTDEQIAISIEIEADRAQMSLGDLEKGFDHLQTKLKNTNRNTEEGRKEFKRLATQMAGTSKEIKNMELSFEGLDREQVASEIGSVAGAVGDLTTSFILLGGENETMEEVGRNIEKAMMVSMGLKGAIEGLSSARKLYNNLIEDGTIEQVKETIATTIATAKTWLLDTAKKAYAATTKLLTGQIKIATVAQRVFNAVVKANPIAILITALAAAGAALIAFASSTKEASREQEILKEIQEDVISGMANEQAELERLSAIAKDETQTKHARNKAIQELNKLSPEYLGNLTLETINTKEATDAMNAYTASLEAQARTKALQEKLNEAVAKQLEAETQATGNLIEELSAWEIATNVLNDPRETLLEKQKENIAAANEEVDAILNLIKAENKQVESHAVAAAARSGFAIDVAALEKKAAEAEAARQKAWEAGAADRAMARSKEQQAKKDALMEDIELDEKKATLFENEINATDEFTNNLIEINNSLAFQKEEEHLRELARIEAEKQAKKEALEKGLALAQQTAESIMSVNDAVRDNALASIDAEYSNETAKRKLTEAEEFAFAKRRDSILKVHFERKKKMDIAMAAINTSQAILQALASAPPPLNFVLAGAAGAAGALQIAAISKQKFAGTAQIPTAPSSTDVTPTGPDAGGGAAITPVSNTSTILGNQQVFVTETDITNTQNNVSVIEESATF